MFNGILRDPEDDAPTDPLSDPITDLSVLPIPNGSLTFGAGSHLKNVVSTLLCISVPFKEISQLVEASKQPLFIMLVNLSV